jgi:hypothetical protein
MARTSSAQNNTYDDDSVSVGRSLIVGSIAGIIACVGFANLQGYGGISNEYWHSGVRSAPTQMQSNSQPPAPMQSSQQYGGNAQQNGAGPEQGNASADQDGVAQEGYGSPQPEQNYGAPTQPQSQPQPGPSDGASEQQPYR